MKCIPKRVLLIHPEGNSFNNPTIKCFIDLLVERRSEIEIRYSASSAPMLKIPGVSLLPIGRIEGKFKKIIINKLFSNKLLWIYLWFERIFVYHRYDLVIGVDREGLIEADMFFRIFGTPYVFLSFEIMFECETSVAYKYMERKAAKSARYWFVQDELRAAHLQQENGLDPTKRLLIPVASRGKGITGVDRLRDRLGIPLEKKVVIAIGGLSVSSMTSEIVASIPTWPADWVLILHERYGHTEDALELVGCKSEAIQSGKIYFSNETSDMVDKMGEILAGISAGLAFYRPVKSSPSKGKNLEYLGLSAGKISTYLRYGVPPIMNEIGMYSDLARVHRFGLVTEDAEGIGLLLPLLKDSTWSENASRFYEEHLDFVNFEDKVLEKLIDAQKK